MWTHTPLTSMLHIRFPIIQAGMAGGVTTPELVSAVSEGGGVGTLGAGYMAPEQIRSAIRAIRSRTSAPFAVNLFVPGPINVPHVHQPIDQLLHAFREELGIASTAEKAKHTESFEEQVAVLLDENIPVASFTFGIPPTDVREALASKGIPWIGTATTVREAILNEEAGATAIVAQGYEAGGHRGSFASLNPLTMIGTMALVPQIVDHVSIPVIGSGGISDGRGIAATLLLGAHGVQLGTAFLRCPESGTHPEHKAAIAESTDESTTITRVFSGKPARGIRNEMMAALQPYEGDIPMYPIQNTLTREIRQAAAKQGKRAYLALWAGQASRLARDLPAKDLLEKLVEETTERLRDATL